MDTEARTTFRTGLQLRVVAAGTLCAFLAVFSATGLGYPVEETKVAYAALISLVGVNGVWWVLGARYGFPLVHFYGHWLVDLVLIWVVVEGLGRPQVSSMIMGYVLIVITSGIFISRAASYLVATAGCVLFGLQAYWTMVPGNGQVGSDAVEAVFPAGGSLLLLLLIAHITGTLGDQMRAANKALTERNSEVATKNNELERVRGELQFHSHVLTHDLRGPMTAASGYLSELRKELRHAADRGWEQLVQMALANMDRVHDMIDTLDEVRRLDHYEDVMTLERFALGEVWADLRVELEEVVDAANVRISLSGADTEIRGSRYMVQVLLRNLIGNAVRFVRHDGSGKIELGAERADFRLMLWVEDNGRGIPAKDRMRVLGLFEKGVGQSGGLGVGLALARRVAEAHEGTIRILEGREQGARVEVEWGGNPCGKKADLPA